MKFRYLAGLAALALAALPAAAQADELKFTLDNQSSHNILYIYVSTPDTEEWGDDILGENMLFPAHNTGAITINNPGDRCEYDLQFTLDNKQTIMEQGLDLCGGDKVYTLTDNQ